MPGPFDHKGMDLVSPINRLKSGFTSLSVNLRSYFKGGVTFRNLLTNAIYTLGAAVHSLRRVNDLTPNGPPSGYSIINGASTVLSLWNSTIGVKNVATGLSGNPISIVPFRPNASVQPWAYIGDSAPQGNVTLATQYLINGTPVNFVSNGMMKVSYNDGYTGTPTPSAVCWKSGVREPQTAPTVSTAPSSVAVSGTLEATAIPWTNLAGANSAYNFGESNGFPGSDGTAPFIVDVLNASYITITSLTGSATINGGTKTPTSSGPVTSQYPAYFVMQKGTGSTPPASASVVIGAFTDGSGNVIPAGVAPLFIPSVTDVGLAIGQQIPIPFGAVAFQIGINSQGNTFNANSGSFSIVISVTTNALPTTTAILGTLALYYWGDSPQSGPVGQYIWKNPDDPSGSGPTRSISDAVGSTTGNSFIFDATFTAGIPGLPGVGNPNVPMEWTTLNPDSVAVGTNDVFAAPITVPAPQNTNNTQFANFNFCLSGSLFFPSAGLYTFVLTSHDDFIWGIRGVTLVSASATYYNGSSSSATTTGISGSGQTITVANGYPLLPRGVQGSNQYEAGTYTVTTVVVSVAAAGIYPIEADYDYWYHSGRIFLIEGSAMAGGGATVIPPLPANVRQDTQYRYVYRSSATGATSNPSPESTAESIPVTSNTITSIWSNDPQVDVVDYYRIDSTTSNFTYVNTGPNDNNGNPFTSPGTNTPVTDSLSDTELGTQLLDYDNFEPFPSIDLPQKGILNSSGGVLTWVSGGAIGGSATGFNPRWLAGTEILIGSPTSLAYTMISRPSLTSTTSASASSSTSTGTSVGGGVAWTNPGNIDSPTLYASVSLVAGGTNYSPIMSSGSASNSATPSNQSPAPVTVSLGTFASQAATAGTLYVTLNGSVISSQGGGTIQLQAVINGGPPQTVYSNGATFGSVTVPFPFSGITNLNQVDIQLVVSAGCSPTGYATLTGNVSNWYATIAGGAGGTSQTLQAAVSGLSVPVGATVVGLEISFNAFNTAGANIDTVKLNVGTEMDAFTLTTSAVGYTAGSSGDLWGYSGWTNATLASLLVNFNASATGTSTVEVGALVVTVYYTELVNVPSMTIPGVPDGTNLAYEIPEPILAAQPLPYMWGPTDNINFAYAVGDPLRPGTLYWCKGSNLDAAPDTNSIEVTSSAEPLMGGSITKGLGCVFSISRAWLILPNFFNALATATGTEGSTWSLQESSITRGLYMPWCVCVSGGGLIFFRVMDGVHVSPGGASSVSITDQDLYPLFPHESSDSGTSIPQPITRNGVTIHPPDDSRPSLQRFSTQGQLMYYDYQGTDGNPHTLVYDIENRGWILDVYTPAVTIHADNAGQSQQGVLTGCSDGTVRLLASG